MDYKFLDKVLDQIVRETIVDIDDDKVTYPVKLSIQVFYETPFAFPNLSRVYKTLWRSIWVKPRWNKICVERI